MTPPGFLRQVLSCLAPLALVALLASPADSALAAGDAKAKTNAKTKVLGTFQDWKAFAYEENGQKVCYISSLPKKLEPAGKSRGDAYVLITHRPAEKTFSVVSVAAGYAYKKDSEVTVKIGRNSFQLFTDKDTAWAREEATDRDISAAIRNGKSMVVKGTSVRNSRTTDTYSLQGAGPAFKAINEACGVKK